MNKISFILIFLICWSCKPKIQDSVILATIPLALIEFLNDEPIILINTGTVENNYFLKSLIKLNADSLLKNPYLKKSLLTQLLNSNDNTYIVNIENLGKVENMNFSHKKSDVDSLLKSNQAVYELGYSRPFVDENHLLYYIELIDVYHRLAGKGVIVQLSNNTESWQVDAVVDGWEMRKDTVTFFGKFD